MLGGLLSLALLAGSPTPAPSPTPCVACRVSTDDVRADYSTEEWSRLEAGEIVSGRAGARDEKGPAADDVSAAGIVPCTPEQIWEVLTDFTSRPRYLRESKEARIVRTEGTKVWVAEKLRISFFTVRFQVVNSSHPSDGVITWKLDRSQPHDIADTHGSWRLYPFPSRRRVLALYQAHVDTGAWIPGFVEHALVRRSLPGMIKAIRTETMRRVKEATIPSLSAGVDSR